MRYRTVEYRLAQSNRKNACAEPKIRYSLRQRVAGLAMDYLPIAS